MNPRTSGAAPWLYDQRIKGSDATQAFPLVTWKSVKAANTASDWSTVKVSSMALLLQVYFKRTLYCSTHLFLVTDCKFVFVRGWTCVFSTTPCSNIASLAAGKAETLCGSSCVVVVYWAINLAECCWLQLGLIVAKATTTAPKKYLSETEEKVELMVKTWSCSIFKLSKRFLSAAEILLEPKSIAKNITVLFNPALLRV